MLTPDEIELYNVARGALPAWFFGKAGRRELFAGDAKQHDWIRRVIRSWFDQTFIGATPTGRYGMAYDSFLDAHAADLGTRRQGGEGSEALRTRLRSFPDALTEPVLTAIANRLIADLGIGPVAFLKMRRDRAFFGTFPAVGADPPRRRFALSRGYRLGTRKVNEYLFILPFGATDQIAKALDTSLRANEAAGNDHIIEIRRVP